MAPAHRRWPKRFGLVVLLAVAAGSGWGYFQNGTGTTPTVNTVDVTRGDIQQLVSATGVLEPSNYVDVGAQVSGQLETIHVRVGQTVSEGDLLAEIDPTVYVAKVDATRAQLKNQQAQIQDRNAQLRLAEIQFQRQQNLFREEATTRESLQMAEASLASAKAQLAMLQAQIEQTSSALRAEEANLGYAHIYAPMDGTVVSIEARQGQTLNAAQTAPLLMRIADLATMRVRAQVSEADVGKIDAGMKVYFTTLGDPDKKLYGTLNYVEPTPEVTNNVVLYNALFDAENEQGRLLPNMTAQVFFIQREALNVLRVPVGAVKNGQVQVVNGAGQTSARGVDTGISNRVHYEVRSGLEEGDRVALLTRDPRATGGNGTPNFRGVLR
ncbi:efflux RND transporter periplasmic adaptor subunit [Marinobacter halophilus]|uniref:Efflux RND transporter periplasmic adaptor subunit n=1 Tax=Marinobacter halophilus TaxID=1323740 RepID=A0A2T1K7W3_9GAMM|nr:efflux RND transporter periplasmic adaptor subunit [Marinobacter halophilus]PSF06249.1 efflux RND transporter periplasmic adaptor subunit [Marinobacter halophilus]GGC70976.1 macrolide transporter [Marinobacter halophilus]